MKLWKQNITYWDRSLNFHSDSDWHESSLLLSFLTVQWSEVILSSLQLQELSQSSMYILKGNCPSVGYARCAVCSRGPKILSVIPHERQIRQVLVHLSFIKTNHMMTRMVGRIMICFVVLMYPCAISCTNPRSLFPNRRLTYILLYERILWILSCTHFLQTFIFCFHAEPGRMVEGLILPSVWNY